jgi:hypothetical protein
MKKVIFVLAIAVVLVAVIAAPALAGKPVLTFNATLTDSQGDITGNLAHGFILVTGRSDAYAEMHVLSLNATADPALLDGMYAFYLQAQGPQKAELKEYFSDKLWTDPAWFKQIDREITGGAPFFYVIAKNGEYSLVDGFSYALFGEAAPLRIDDNYPLGTYAYKGHLKASNNALLQVTISLEIE